MTTNDARHQRAMEILAEALECPLEQRAPLLDRSCGGNAALRHIVEGLLASEAAAAPFLEEPLVSHLHFLEHDADRTLIGETLGPYRISAEVGRGGMAAVYEAVRDDEAYQRRVAIKVIKRGMDTDAIHRRFRRERQILADLDHPYIARLFDGGTTPDGRPYLVMEHVAGRPIVRYADQRQLDEAARLTLFLKVCEAVQHAHEHQVVHGDIKPPNILVAEDGTPKLLDFGVARILNPPRSATDAATGDWRPLTPEYASPEQRQGQPITAASDIYSLGAVLHELVAGRRPGAKPGHGEPRLKRDLDNIVRMALREEPDRRYGSVALLTADISRYLEGRPVAARKGTLIYRGQSFARRHSRLLVTAAAGAVVCLAAGGIVTWLALRPEPRQSIAVLPFAATTSDQETAILADGITENLISSLARLPGISAPARDSMFGLRGQVAAPADAVRSLHVDTVLVGHVTSSYERVSVNASLFDAKTGEAIWIRVYDTPSFEILSLQQQLLADVSQQLGTPRTASDGVPLPWRYTSNETAFRRFLAGRHLWNAREHSALVQALPHFEAAIAADPRFALAYSGLADTHGLIGAYLGKPADEAFPAAKTAALQALALDDTLAEAHTSLALVTWLYDWDWRKADEEFRRAVTLDPRFPRAHHWYGLFLGEMGRFDEAYAQMRMALELDPQSAPIHADFGRVYFWARDYVKSREYYRRAFELRAGLSFVIEALELYEQSDEAEWLRAMTQLTSPVGKFSMEDRRLNLYRSQGRAAYWRDMLTSVDLRPLRAHPPVPPAGVNDMVGIAEALIRVGDKDLALTALEAAFRTRNHRITQLKVNPVLDPIRSDPRFADLLRRMHLND